MFGISALSKKTTPHNPISGYCVPWIITTVHYLQTGLIWSQNDQQAHLLFIGKVIACLNRFSLVLLGEVDIFISPAAATQCIWHVTAILIELQSTINWVISDNILILSVWNVSNFIQLINLLAFIWWNNLHITDIYYLILCFISLHNAQLELQPYSQNETYNLHQYFITLQYMSQ